MIKINSRIYVIIFIKIINKEIENICPHTNENFYEKN